MRLFEYQSKKIFKQFGIPVTKGKLTSVAGEAKHIAEEYGGSAVIKAQVLVTGRGRAGGILLAKNSNQAEKQATKVLGMEIMGKRVRRVLVDELISIAREIYVAIIVDQNGHQPILIASPEGGIYIEEIAIQSPEKIIKTYIDPLIGLREYQIRELAANIDLPHQYWGQFMKTLKGLWAAFINSDATLAEINPLVISTDDRLVALDGKLVVDDNAYFRHPEFAELLDAGLIELGELESRKYGFSYLKLEGDIGCLVNGAGLAMTVMDIIQMQGGNPANFLDLGGGASSEKIAGALRLILSDVDIHSVLINIFGGLTRCDEIARGILQVLEEKKPEIPVVVRLVGTNAGEGLELIRDAHLLTSETLVGAVQKAVEAAKGEWNGHLN